MRGVPRFDTGMRLGPEPREVDWVPVREAAPDDDVVRAHAQADGAARIARGEGLTVRVEDGRVSILVSATIGGRGALGQILELCPEGDGGSLRVLAASDGRHDLEMPDNLTVGPGDRVYLCEDGGGHDFVRGLDPRIATALGALTALLALAWFATQIRATARGRPPAWGRWLLLGATAFAWYAGLVAFDSDYAFTVTNIPLHALPYAWLAVRYARSRATEPGAPPLLSRLVRAGPLAIAALLILVALLEEAGWDRLVWHDHPQFFGPSSPLDDAWVALLAPLLAVPQLTHYVLDGFVWRREGNE